MAHSDGHNGAIQNTEANSRGFRESLRTARLRSAPYVLAVVATGCGALAVSVLDLSAVLPPVQWWVLLALTLISGSAVLKIPSTSINFSISDVFTLTSAMLYGPAAGTVAVAIDSLVISLRLVRAGLTFERILFNAAAPPLAMWVAATTFFRASGLQPLIDTPVGIDVVGPWLLLFAALYFVLNTFAVAIAIALHDRANAFAIWRTHFQNLWITFLGGGLGAAFVVFGLQLGRYGIVVLSFPLFLAVILHFAYRHATGRVAEQLSHLAEVNRLHLSTIEALAHAIDAKDGVTHDHIRRVQTKAVELAVRLGLGDPLELKAIEAAALLHDVGKLAIPERILNKPGKLTASEFERMKSHARIGAEILAEVEFPYPVVPIVRHHHENWDGSGYPDGLQGSKIPLGARILAVVDCFDALTSDRPYRRALSMEEAFEVINARRDTMYDPAIVDAFRALCVSNGTPEAARHDHAASETSRSAADAATTAGTRESLDEVVLALRLGAALRTGSAKECPWRLLMHALCGLPGVDTAVLFVHDEAGECLRPVRFGGKYERALSSLAIPIGERVTGWVASVGQAVVNGDAALDLFDVPGHALRSVVAVPFRQADGTQSVIALYSTLSSSFGDVYRRLVDAAVVFATSQKPVVLRVDNNRPAVHVANHSLHVF
jgi:putative nucleotidyltransferase with HDIG domain